jgi:2-haloalkanoic acid dehalogenase type II
VTHPEISAVVFDCFGTLIDFGDAAFMQAYETICAEQDIAVSGRVFFDKWMEIWRRLARDGLASDGGSVGVAMAANVPGPLSEAELFPPHPRHHTPSAGRNRALSGPLPPFRPYREEWPEHFALCFEELGVSGDPQLAHTRLVEMLSRAAAFSESLEVVEALRPRLPIALLSNADDDFLGPCLEFNGLEFPVVVSSEAARAYKPHEAIFQTMAGALSMPPERILYVGDSPLADVTGAKHAGLRAAWVNRRRAADAGNRSLEAAATEAESQTSLRTRLEPDFEIDSLTRLLDILGVGGTADGRA